MPREIDVWFFIAPTTWSKKKKEKVPYDQIDVASAALLGLSNLTHVSAHMTRVMGSRRVKVLDVREDTVERVFVWRIFGHFFRPVCASCMQRSV